MSNVKLAQLLDQCVAVNTAYLVEPSRDTRHSDPDFSRTSLAARADVHCVRKKTAPLNKTL